MQKKFIFVIPILFGLAACSGTTDLKMYAADEQVVPDWYIKHQPEKKDSSWFSQKNTTEFFEVAEDVSPSFDLAIKKATMKAKARLLDRLQGKTSAESTLRVREDMNLRQSIVSGSVDAVVADQVQSLSLDRYQTIKRFGYRIKETGNYRVFVMISYVVDENLGQ